MDKKCICPIDPNTGELYLVRNTDGSMGPAWNTGCPVHGTPKAQRACPTCGQIAESKDINEWEIET